MKDIKFKLCSECLPAESGYYLCYTFGRKYPGLEYLNLEYLADHLDESPWTSTIYEVVAWLDTKEIPTDGILFDADGYVMHSPK